MNSAITLSLLCGALGGLVAGGLVPEKSLGTAGNAIVGIVGGGLGGQILSRFGLTVGGDGANGLMMNLLASAVGGVVLLMVIGLVRAGLNR